LSRRSERERSTKSRGVGSSIHLESLTQRGRKVEREGGEKGTNGHGKVEKHIDGHRSRVAVEPKVDDGIDRGGDEPCRQMAIS
jgi:hypothetical protein